jgi:hypothetical protein
MSIVKLTKKEDLDRIIANITLRLGRRPTQQDVLDKIIELGETHLEELIDKLNEHPIIDDKKIESILSMHEELKKIPRVKVKLEKIVSKDDRDIYLS